MARTTSASGPPRWLPIALIVAGLVVGIVPGARLVTSVIRAMVDTFDAPTIDTPADVGLELDDGRHLVFERTGTTDAVGGAGFEVRSTRDGPTALTPELVQVVALATGERVRVTACRCDETITKDDRIYTASLAFEVREAGEHALRFSGPRGEVIVTESLVDAFDGLGRSMWFGVLGAVIVAVGVALLVWALVGRRDA